MPHVARIFVYPIKALDGIPVDQAIILPGGSLQHDREFALFDHAGKRINGKRDRRIHSIRAQYDLSAFTVTLNGEPFELSANPRLEGWFSDFFGQPIHIERNLETGFPDDLDASGPTVVSSATLRAVGDWFG